MVQDLTHATIRELIIALDEVERSIIEGRTVSLDPVGGARAGDPSLARLTELEERISRELAARRADMHLHHAVREVMR